MNIHFFSSSYNGTAANNNSKCTKVILVPLNFNVGTSSLIIIKSSNTGYQSSFIPLSNKEFDVTGLKVQPLTMKLAILILLSKL